MNNYNPNIHHRKSIRLKGYDYSQAGLYFITICCERRGNPLWLPFGEITDDKMFLNDAGKMIETEWLELTTRFPNIALHEYITMPNHFHGILQITTKHVGAPLVGAQNTTPTNNVGATLVVAQNNNGEQNNANGNIVRASLVDAPNNNITTTNNKTTTIDNKRATTRVAPTTDGTGEIMAGHPQGVPQRSPVTNKTVGDMMDAFKSITTVQYINGVKTMGWSRFDGKLWQRNYHEHIIRDEKSYHTISEYIINNPANWNADKFYK